MLPVMKPKGYHKDFWNWGDFRRLAEFRPKVSLKNTAARLLSADGRTTAFLGRGQPQLSCSTYILHVPYYETDANVWPIAMPCGLNPLIYVCNRGSGFIVNLSACIITVCVRHSRSELYIDHGWPSVCLCVWLTVPRTIATLLHRPRCNLGKW